MQRIYVMFLTLFMAMALVACDHESAALNTYKTLNSSAITYDTVMKSAADMRDAGQFSDEKWAELVDAATIYYDAYQAAVSALYVYVEAQEKAQTPDTSLLVTAASQCSEALNDFVQKAYQLGVTIKDTVGGNDG